MLKVLTQRPMLSPLEHSTNFSALESHTTRYNALPTQSAVLMALAHMKWNMHMYLNILCIETRLRVCNILSLNST